MTVSPLAGTLSTMRTDSTYDVQTVDGEFHRVVARTAAQAREMVRLITPVKIVATYRRGFVTS